MNLFSKLFIFIYLVVFIFFTEKVLSEDLVYDSPNFHYINDWVIKITGGDAVAEKVARDYNYKNLGPVSRKI